MTHMLQSLAGGKLVVALEVLLPGFLPQAPNLIIDCSGWLQCQLNFDVCDGRDARSAGRISA